MTQFVEQVTELSLPRTKSFYIKLEQYDLIHESERLESFSNNRWRNTFFDANELAEQGFFFYKSPDTVQCYFCDLELSDFKHNDNVTEDHSRYSPSCSSLLKKHFKEA
jgi:Inhibitor of Apoptosis domain